MIWKKILYGKKYKGGFMTIKEIKTPQDILTFMNENIQYGWLDINNEKHLGNMKGFRKLYRTMSMDEVLKYGIGTCIEQVKLMSDLLTMLKIPNKMFCTRIYEGKDFNNLEAEEHMHCFVLYYLNNKVYQIDHPNWEKIGIYAYNSELEAIAKINNYYIELVDGKARPVTEFFMVKPNISFKDFNNYINSLDEKRCKMKTDNIIVNTQSSIKIILDKILYFDPFQIEDSLHDADIIFLTHNHYDHFDVKSIVNIKKANTLIIAPKSMETDIKNMFEHYLLLNPNEEISIDNINIKTIPAYNNFKNFHPKDNNWLGYLINYNNITYYIAGDTDKTEDNEKVNCDIAIIPIGGYYTMDYKEASELLKIIKPQIVIPTHYGSIIGDIKDGKRLENSLMNTNIEVIEKIKF